MALQVIYLYKSVTLSVCVTHVKRYIPLQVINVIRMRDSRESCDGASRSYALYISDILIRSLPLVIDV